MGTGIFLFLDWKNGIWVTGTGNKSHKNENGKHVCYYKDNVLVCHILSSVARKKVWKEFWLKQTRELHSVQHTMQLLSWKSAAFVLITGKTSSKKSNATQNCVLKLYIKMKNLLWDFFLISILGLGFGLNKGWEMGFRENLRWEMGMRSPLQDPPGGQFNSLPQKGVHCITPFHFKI